MLSLRYIALGIARTTAARPEPRATDAAAVTDRPPAGRTCYVEYRPAAVFCRLGERLNANAAAGVLASNPCKMLSLPHLRRAC